MNMAIYNRPTKTKAAAVGQKARTRWSSALRTAAFDLLLPIEVIAAEESVAATTRNRQGHNHHAAWTSVRMRFHQVALMDILRQRHLRNTGKEISRAEALAALMTAGLAAVLERKEFAHDTIDA